MNTFKIISTILEAQFDAVLCIFGPPKPKKYKVMEDPDELGYWLEEVDEDID